MTGFDFADFSVGGKWLELLKEAAPAVTRVAVMYNPQTSPGAWRKSRRATADSLSFEACRRRIGYQNTATPPRPPTTDVSKPTPTAPCPWTW
jgi:hypothetical protein